MEIFYLIIVIILFALAISDLVVGVSNDAVNFLNSAVGSKAATFRVILIIAAAGIIFGCTFSSGMMEVARKGIFHPEHFYFSEIILLFLAVMVADIILLDSFNTFGMPTSTTVSIVFELLGAAVAFSVIKIYTQPQGLGIAEYINADKAMAIISGIFLSVFIAFTVGVIVQYFTRLLFSFNYESKMKYFGSIWGGFAIAAITYFLLVKGVKGASFMNDSIKAAVHDNAFWIISLSFVAWTIILQLILVFFKGFDIMKFIVLIGTFALAMAFAGNDLVNFIGVPLAGYNSFELYQASGEASNSFLMSGLAGKVPTPTLLLILAGVIMTITLWTSDKAKSVLKTSLDLGRQHTGTERFASYKVSRSIVRVSSKIANKVEYILPQRVKNYMLSQFDEKPFITKQVSLGAEAPAFDMLRAATTLVVASILISVGTSFKLPLSTTYITFMVFMGTSLADGAWGRESAVYRISGVLSVIGGWFFTAFSAFILAFIIATLFHFGGVFAVVAILVLAGVLIYRTNLLHKKRIAEKEEFEKTIEEGSLNRGKVLEVSAKTLNRYLGHFVRDIDAAIDGLKTENLDALTKIGKDFKPIYEQSSMLRGIANDSLDKIDEENLDVAHLYILALEYTHEMARNVNDIVNPILNYVDNNHKSFLPAQIEELKTIHTSLKEKMIATINVYKNDDQQGALDLLVQMDDFIKLIRTVRKKQIKRIKNHVIGTRNSILYLTLLGELRSMGWYASRMVKVYLDLVEGQAEKEEGDTSIESSKKEN
ncbi:MAG: inorganic phosphate transporter [Saprospiraceae bacterium]|nr:inorganic phosphate transporter [Saprospiraceae bacterium]